MDLGLHDYMEKPHACVYDGKDKMVFSYLMFDNWLSVDDMHTNDISTCNVIPMHGQEVWILERMHFVGILERVINSQWHACPCVNSTYAHVLWFLVKIKMVLDAFGLVVIHISREKNGSFEC